MSFLIYRLANKNGHGLSYENAFVQTITSGLTGRYARTLLREGSGTHASS